jgi:NTP pyrophosphatase (non-canonical NTP hydrolase)
MQTNHYFNDKCVLFMGTLERCSRRDAMDRLFFDCNGIPVTNFAVWVEHFIAGRGAETTVDYLKAQELEERGAGTILTEQEFFDALDGKYIPPTNPNKTESTAMVFLPIGMTAEQSKAEDAAHRAEFLEIKRDEYLRKRKPGNNKYDVRLQNDMTLRFDYAQMSMMWGALEKWGEAAQADQTIEECAELIVALNKHRREPTPETLENIIDEISDLEMMLAQIRLMYGVSDDMLYKRIKKKFPKLEKYLKK